MNTTIITILILEIIIISTVLYFIIKWNLAVNKLNKKIIEENKKLKTIIPTAREILSLTHQYIDLWKIEFVKKIEATINILSEVAVYYIMHKIFKDKYETFEKGFSFAKLFWQ